jgi:hypothetical protein
LGLGFVTSSIFRAGSQIICKTGAAGFPPTLGAACKKQVSSDRLRAGFRGAALVLMNGMVVGASFSILLPKYRRTGKPFGKLAPLRGMAS